MAIEIRQRDGKRYYYYKLTGGETLYLGTLESVNRKNLDKAYAQFKRTKDRALKEEQIFDTLLAAIEKAGKDG